MAHARVIFELDGLMYGVGPVRVGLAMRAATSREFSLLRPFPTVAAAERMCRALSRAQVVRFADEEAARVDGGVARRSEPRKRRPGRRRRMLTTLVDPASVPARRPSAPTHQSVVSPSLPSRPIPRRSPLDRRPSPDTVTELTTVMDRLETKSE